MYTLSPNEKLGMQFEQVRLAEIRQQIEARRLASEVQREHFGLGKLIHALSTFATVGKTHFIAKVSTQLPIRQIAKSQKSFYESN